MNETKPKKLLFIGVDQAIPYLLDKYVSEGVLPNVQRLIDNGVLAEGLSCPPCDTPTNWTTIATGATTAVHGATSFYLHIPGEPFELSMDLRSRTQLSKYCQAEYIWDVADREGLKPFVTNYPSGWPANFKDGAMSVLAWPIPESLPRMLATGLTLSFDKDAENKELKVAVADNSRLGLTSISPPLHTTIYLQHGSIKEPFVFNTYITNFEGKGYDTLTFTLNSPEEWQMIRADQWSEWIPVTLETTYGTLPCLFKIKFSDLAQDGSSIKITRSAIFNIKGWSVPESMGEGILRNAFFYDLEKEKKVEYMIEGDIDAFLQYARQEAVTITNTVKYAKKVLNWRTCFFHVHYLDSVNHKMLAKLHKGSPIYNEEGTEKAENQIKTAYKILDEMVGELLGTCVDEETIVALVSDHGAIPSWRNANIPLALRNANLLVYKWSDSARKFLVDWEKTKAFPYMEPPYIWVNLKGRDPNGSVSQGEYESVRDEIIEALKTMKDSDTGEKIVKIALRKEDAADLGQNGERIGDVVYFLNPPYQIFDGNLAQLTASEQSKRSMKRPEAYKARDCFGAHAYYLPDTKFGNYSVSVPLVFSGPGIKSGVQIKDIVNLIDIAPTLAHLLDITKPKDAQGRILNEILI